MPVKGCRLAIKDQLPYAGAVGIEPSLDQVPQLPVQGEQQRVLTQQRLAEGASTNLQSVGQLLANAGGGRAEGANWWWPQEEAAGSS